MTAQHCRQQLTPASAQIDAAKFADLVLLLVDGNYGFEMETFEFLNLLQVHGFPKVMGVLTHLDEFTDAKKLRQVKKQLKVRAEGGAGNTPCALCNSRLTQHGPTQHRFWTEIYNGAKLFYISGMVRPRSYCHAHPGTRLTRTCRSTGGTTSATHTTWRGSSPSPRHDRHPCCVHTCPLC